jgi:NAD(P)-dependent dehydrogenase (short-subunit alcohol dehydrogenase family)
MEGLENSPSSTQEVIAVPSSSDRPDAPVNYRDARDLFDLTGRVAVVTGGTRGLGLAMVRAFASAGADVVVVSRKPEACEEVVATLRSEGLKAAGCACHVGHWDELEPLVERVHGDFGRIDVLVNNAGISPMYGKLSEVTEELFDKVIGVNLKGPFRLAALVGERMVAAGGGSIINVSSTGAIRPTGDIVPYAAAKAGVNAMTIGLAHAFGPTVRVNAVMPGPFLTTIARSWDMDVFAERARTFPMRRAGQSEEIVGAAMYLASDASTYTTGSIIVVDGGAQWSMAGTGDGAPDAGPATEDAGVATECAGGPSPGDPAAARLEVNSNPR